MDSKLVAALVVLAMAIAACSSEQAPGERQEEPILTAATLGEQTVLNTDEYLAQERYATADLEQGKLQAQVCRACHTLEADGVHMIGPRLHGVFGSRAGKAGSAAGPIRARQTAMARRALGNGSDRPSASAGTALMALGPIWAKASAAAMRA